MTTVLCHGVFDALHPGHVAHLTEAKALGDWLIVSVVADRFVNKGPGRPVFNENHRRDMLEALSVVDQVEVSVEEGALPLLDAVQPDIYVRGPDYADPNHQFSEAFNEERRIVEGYGGRIVFTDAPVMSSTDIIRDSLPQHPRLTIEWLRAFGKRFPAKHILKQIDRAASMTVLCIGERIIDEYIDIYPQGRSAKETIVTWTEGKRHVYEGGVAAVAGHTRAVSDHVETWAYDDWGILPVITKTRYVESPAKKIFGIYRTEPSQMTPEFPTRGQLLNHHVVTVVDYGHGLIDTGVAKDLETDHWRHGFVDLAPDAELHWLALTVQANSSNWGMNTLHKWKRADYIVVDEAELRLAYQDSETAIGILAQRALAKWTPEVFVVTLGSNGCIVARQNQPHALIPALGVNVVDRIGAGDTFLALSAPLIRAGVDAEIAAFVGSVGAAIQVSYVGTGHTVTREELRQWVKALVK